VRSGFHSRRITDPHSGHTPLTLPVRLYPQLAHPCRDLRRRLRIGLSNPLTMTIAGMIAAIGTIGPSEN